MNELAGFPCLDLAPVHCFLFHHALGVVPQFGDNFVLLVEQGDAGCSSGTNNKFFQVSKFAGIP